MRSPRSLAGRGCRVLAIDLPGHGLKAKFPEAYLRQDLAALATEPSPLKDVTLDDYVAAGRDGRPGPGPTRPGDGGRATA